MQNIFLLLLITFLAAGCRQMNPDTNAEVQQSPATELEFDLPKGPFVMVLGVAQDAGYPQMDCQKSCCAPVWTGEQNAKRVSCLAVVNPQTGAAYIIDATPDFKMQWQQLSELPLTQPTQLAGIFLTHAHMGHYTGLLHLGREAMGASDIPIYAMPRMKEFLENNGPWSQLVQLNNIKTIALQHDSTIYLQNDLRITPLQVPHRDEFSETVGYRIEGPEEKVLFIPDIDKWEKWDRDIRSEIAGVDRAYLDGSFFKNGELPNRDMSEIPHPFVEESMQLFEGLSPNEQAKVHFIHFNHTNPLLRENSAAQQQLEAAGFNLAVEGNIFAL